MRNTNDEAGERSRFRRGWFQSEAGMRYDRQPILRDAREEAMQW